MRKLIIALFSLVYSMASFSQDSLISYYDSSWKPATPGDYTYYQKKTKSADGWKAEHFYRSGKILMTGTFNDESATVRNGDFIWYLENGDTMRIAHFANGQPDGINITFYPSGKRNRQGFYKMGNYDGDWVGFYESGKISGTAHYENDKQLAAEMYNEDGSINKEITLFERDPGFPGGKQAFARFYNKTLRYPDKAVTNNTQGKVMVAFFVEKDGALSDFTIAEAADESLNTEALRVARTMPKWEPAIRGGRIVREHWRQLFTFRLVNGN